MNARLAIAAVIARSLRAPPAPARKDAAATGPYAREVAEAIPRIEQATGLKFKTPPKVEVRTQRAGARLPPEAVRRGDARRAARGRGEGVQAARPHPRHDEPARRSSCACSPSRSSATTIPRRRRCTSSNGADEQIVGITITHELVHALQDQYVNLDSIQKSGVDNDRLAAAQALVEGEAQFEQISIMLGGPDQIEARLPGALGSRARGDPQSPGRDAGVRHGADGHPGVAALPVSERRRVRAARQGEARQRRSLPRHPALDRADPASADASSARRPTSRRRSCCPRRAARRRSTRTTWASSGRGSSSTLPPRSADARSGRPPGGMATASWSSRSGGERGSCGRSCGTRRSRPPSSPTP